MKAVIPLDPKTVVLSPCGARFNQSLDKADWKALWPNLRGWTSSLHWLLGDWLNFGKKTYGEKYALALDQTEVEYQLLRDCAWVCAAVPLASREESLSWTHHREVAPLAPRDQKRFLKLATEDRWTVSQLRRAIRAEEASVDEQPRTPAFMPRAWAEQGMRYFLRQEVEGWEPQRREALKEELRPIIELFERL